MSAHVLPVRSVIALALLVAGATVLVHLGVAEAQTTDTLRDEFRSVSFSGNDGTRTWMGPWVEVGESDGPTAGSLRVIANERCADGSGNCLSIGADEEGLSGISITRRADLSGADTATLSFVFRRGKGADGSGLVRVEVTGDGGATWTTLERIDLDGPRRQFVRTYDVTDEATAAFLLRLAGEGSDIQGAILFDDIEIAVATDPPPSSTTLATTTSTLTTTSTITTTTTASTTTTTGAPSTTIPVPGHTSTTTLFENDPVDVSTSTTSTTIGTSQVTAPPPAKGGSSIDEAADGTSPFPPDQGDVEGTATSADPSVADEPQGNGGADAPNGDDRSLLAIIGAAAAAAAPGAAVLVALVAVMSTYGVEPRSPKGSVADRGSRSR